MHIVHDGQALHYEVIVNSKSLTQIMAKLIKANFFIRVHQQFLPKGSVQEISIGHGADKNFYSSGVGGFQMGDLAGM